MSDLPQAASDKASLRRLAKQRRAEAAAANPEAGAHASEHAAVRLAGMAPGCVAAYWPMGDELDPRPLMHRLHGAGWALALPAMQGAGKPLVFRQWAPGEALVSAGFGTQVPDPSVPELTPGVVLVPMLAFDRAGYRLGYGGGFYDRTLEQLRAGDAQTLALGLAYAGQEVADALAGAHDQPLDGVVTEAGLITVGRAS